MTSLALLLLLQASPAGAPHPFRVEDMQRLRRVGQVALSPDGRWVAYTLQRSDVLKNKTVTNLWLISSRGSSRVQLTYADQGSNSRPRWSPDSKFLYFLSTREKNTPQIYRLATAGGEAQQLTHIEVGVTSFVISPDGRTIALTVRVFPECKDLACSAKRRKEVEESPVKVRTITSLPFRRWDEWVDGNRNHIFIMPAEGERPKTSRRVTWILPSGPKAEAKRLPSHPTAGKSRSPGSPRTRP